MTKGKSKKLENVDHLDTGKRILLEPGTQLQIEIEGVASRFKSTLVGIKPDEYLIVKTPKAALSGGVKNRLFRGNQIVIRYLYKGTVFGFQYKLVEAIFSPKQLLLVEYPKIIENCDLRSHERIDCLFPAKITIEDEERHGAVLDISQGGCRYLIKTLKGEKLPSVQIDEQVTLRCQFPGIEGEQILSGKVRNMKTDEQETALGIEFHEIAPEVENIIVQYISTVKESS
jgi:c-di-GMP-binding flagellar brake protein YcgR